MVGAGCQGSQPLTDGWLELSVPPPDFWGGERGWRLNPSPTANDLINPVYAMKPP